MTDDWSARLIHGDCVQAMAALEPESVHAVVCDPPYGLEFMGKDWDSFRGGARFSKMGFGADGDKPTPSFGSGLQAMRAFQDWSELWAAEALRVLRPGGHLLAFGGSRTYHRLGCAVEESGFEVRDCLEWIYGQGMPKSRDAGDLIDAKLGVEREVIGSAVGADPSVTRPGFTGEAHSTVANQTKTYDVTVATSPEAKEWDGWGTTLKPAHEPIVLARKTLDGTVASNLLEHNAGTLNVTANRVGESGGTGSRILSSGGTGRFPSNVLIGHSLACAGGGVEHTETLCVDGCPARLINETSEGAARFFYCSKPRSRERIGGTIKNLHPTVKPIDLMRWLVRLVTPVGGIVLDPFLGSGSTGCAAMIEGARFIGIERDDDSFETALARVSDYAFAHGRSRPEKMNT